MISIKRFILNILQDVLPCRFKRMLVLSSLYGFIKEIASNDINYTPLHKINCILRLAREDEALFIPVNKPYWFWDPKMLESEMRLKNGQVIGSIISVLSNDIAEVSNNSAMLNLVSHYLAVVVPDWLRYQSDRSMRHDIRNLLQSFVSSDDKIRA